LSSENSTEINRQGNPSYETPKRGSIPHENLAEHLQTDEKDKRNDSERQSINKSDNSGEGLSPSNNTSIRIFELIENNDTAGLKQFVSV